MVVLLICNCSAHDTVDSVVALNNVEVPFLPPNTTSKFQPMDAGVIVSVKLRYRSAHMDQAIDLMEENVSEIYKIDILSAMRALKSVWVELPGNIIKQGWSHTKVGPATIQVESATNLASSLASERSRLEEQISIMVLIDAPGESKCIRHCDAQDMLFPDKEDSKGELDLEPAENPLLSLKVQLKVLALAKRIIGALPGYDYSALRTLSCAQSFITLDLSTKARQSTQTEFFT